MFGDPQFWVFVAFIIFFIAIFKPVRKILASGLDKKIYEIKNSIDKAEKIKNEAQITLSEIKKRQNEVKQEIEIIQNNAKEKITTIEQLFNQKLNEKIEKRNEQTKIKIEQMFRDANTQVQQYIVQNVIKVTIAILEKKLNQSEKQKLINQSIADLNSIIKN
jgi:F-type H+-transporting ATPase subunit b|tara:strand:+ start:266 stop:751 length:486 start_codon:yes stop_codon:yes gene_type:complete